jgi:AAA domain
MPPKARTGTRARQGLSRGKTAKQENDNPAYMAEDEVTIEVTTLGSVRPRKNIVIHGPAGHGKTVLAGGVSLYEKAGRCAFLSTEADGAVSSRQAGGVAELWPAPSWEHAIAGVSKAEQELVEGDWLIVDSGTEMQMLYIRWILGKIHSIKPDRDLDIPAIKDHQKWQNGFMRWYSRIINMPCNTIFVCTSMTVEDAEGETRVIPHILGKKGEISDYISQLAGVVLYYSVSRESRESEATGKDIVRRALAQPFPPWLAKDRFTALGTYWDVAYGDYTAMADMVRAMDKSLAKTAADERRRANGRRSSASRPRRSGVRVAS